MHLQFDEWLGGWHANPVLSWEGSLPAFLRDFWANARHYVTSGQTVLWSSLVEALKLLTGPSVVAVRTVAALGGAFAASAVFVIARKIFARPAAAYAAAILAVFSVSGVVFGQFADVYASAVFASALQLSAYFLVARPRSDLKGWLLFSLAAFASGLFMYTQLWLTAGIFLGAAWDARRSVRRLAALAAGGVLFAALSAAHLRLALRIIPWSESYRWYMDSYYPLFLRGGGGLVRLPAYLAVRLYDLFNYHLSLVFDPKVYQPLSWNWVSLPFLIVLAVGIGCRVWPNRQPSTVNRQPKSGSRFTVHGSRLTEASAVPCLLLATLAACLIANLFLLIPFGGVRQMFFLAPVFALFYGWLVDGIVLRGERAAAVAFLAVLLCLLPLLPFALSLPGLYRDRVSRLELDLLAESLDRFQPQALLASEQNIQILEMALARDQRFSRVRWPGYRYPGDALDADFVRNFPTLDFSYRGRDWSVRWVTRDYFPPGLNDALWVDMHISRGSRFEGPSMRRFYPDPAEAIPAGYRIAPVREVPGTAPAALHQSIYWPPNSFYLYRVVRDGPSRERAGL
jgi:hypothetical protein